MYLSFYFQIHTERNMNFPNSVPNSMPNSRQIVLILAYSDLELGSRSRAKSTLDISSLTKLVVEQTANSTKLYCDWCNWC